MSLGVLQLWSEGADNLVTPYRVCEYAVLRVWQELHADIRAGSKDVVAEYLGILSRLTALVARITFDCFRTTKHGTGFVRALPESVSVTNRVFEELGRLGLQGCPRAELHV
jgi:hypothetical protein